MYLTDKPHSAESKSILKIKAMKPFRVLLSVSDKTGLIELATRLIKLGAEIVSTSGTANAIIGAGLPCTLVENVTGFLEMLDGRVKSNLLDIEVCP